MNINQKLKQECFKIDRVNGWAMLDGFDKNSKKIKQAIYCISNRAIWADRNFRLLTYSDDIPYENFLSPSIGIPLKNKYSQNPDLRYIAITDTLYEIKLDINLWKTLCSNDIFDIWMPQAPIQRFEDYLKKHINQPTFFLAIALIRIYEIEGAGYTSYDLHQGYGDFAPYLEKDKLNVRIRKPVICKDKFLDIKSKLESVLVNSKFLIGNPIKVVNTTENDNSVCEDTEPIISTENSNNNKNSQDKNERNDDIPEPIRRIYTIEEIDKFNICTIVDLKSISDTFDEVEPKVKEIITKKIERGNFAEKVKEHVGYKCMLCEKLYNGETHSFQKANGKTYVEVHHVIPVSKLKKGSLSVTNLITVCANHHKQLHYGNVEYEIKDKHFIFKLDTTTIIVDKIDLDKVK